MLALDIRDLHFSYDHDQHDHVHVLNGIDLALEAGSCIGLVGPNGAGKTTLFHCICGILEPSAGQIDLFGNPVIPNKFHPDVGLVFQYPDEQLFSPTVCEDVAFAPHNMGFSPDEVEDRVATALDVTGISHLRDRAPHQLSGGQKRMVAIAGIQAMRPRLIIYDEPSANLDMRSRRRLINYINASDETVIVSSHDLELVLELADRVILLDEGRIITDGHPDQIMGDVELMLAHGLEKPHSLRPHIHTSIPVPHKHY